MIQFRLSLVSDEGWCVYKDIAMTALPRIGEKIYIGDDFFKVTDVRYRSGGFPIDPQHHMPEISVVCSGLGAEYETLPLRAMRIAYQEYEWTADKDACESEEEWQEIKKSLEDE